MSAGRRLLIFDFRPANGCLGLVNKLSSILDCPCLPAGRVRQVRLAVSAKPCSPASKSYYQPVVLRFASLPALSSLEPKRNLPDGSQDSPAGGQGLISLPVLILACAGAETVVGHRGRLYLAGQRRSTAALAKAFVVPARVCQESPRI